MIQKKKYILALDQGTTSSRAIVFDREAMIVSQAQEEFPQHFPRNGWVEHDPEDIWNSQLRVMRQALKIAGIKGNDLAGIGITNQRETALAWDRNSGKAVYNAIVWQDRRTAGRCEKLKAKGLEEMIRGKTGLVVDAYFSASKWQWILENVDGAKQKAESGELMLGTVDSWLLWKLTGGMVHITDASNASRTMLFNIHTLRWDAGLLDLFGIPPDTLPEVRSSSEEYAKTDREVFGFSVPIAGMAGDQQAAAIGQMCLDPGQVKCTFGTGCFILCNTGSEIVPSKNRLISTVAMQLGGQTSYALEGSIFAGGSVVQWLRDGLGLIRDSASVETLAKSVPDNGGVYLVPAFTGLGAPHWDPDARGLITGLERRSNAGHIARAALESIAFQVSEVVSAMEEDAGMKFGALKVDGGAAVNNLLMQIQSDILGIPVTRPANTETTALGVACLAGLATGFWSGMDEIGNLWEPEKTFKPTFSSVQREYLMSSWKTAVRRCRSVY